MRVSVAMCTFNGEKFIEEQLDSILNQTLKVDEIVVCDDGSTDATIEILNKYSKKYSNVFHIHQNKINLRSVKNFEKAISICSGDIIFLSDQDDVWMQNKVENFLIYFKENPTIKAIASNGYCINEKSVKQEKYSVWDAPQFLKEKNIDFNYFSIISRAGNIATGASMAFKSEILNKILPFPVVQNFHHDEWIALITSRNNEFVMLPEKYFSYRIHNNQQVGGVFFDKTEKEKRNLIQQYHLNDTNLNFTNLKRRLKRQITAYERHLELVKFFNYESSFLKENLLIIEKSHNQTREILQKKYPIKAFFMNKLDALLKKRQFNPIKL